jgi:hypothetical protein
MTISYSNFNRRENIFEPSVQKNRLTYKGPVPSSLINLFNDQFLLDVNRLKKKIDELNESLEYISQMTGNDLNLATPDYYLNEELLMTIYSQEVSYDESSEDYLITSSTPYYEDSLYFEKFNKNSGMISFLSAKLASIEAALKKDI